MSPTYADLFKVFGRIGVLSFGGPAAQIALMHQELVDDRRWLNEDSFLRGLSFCMLLPGPEAMQLATYTGWRLKGTWGGLLAGSLFVLPGAFVIAALVFLYATFGSQPLVVAGFIGIKAAVVTIVFKALLGLRRKALNRSVDWVYSAFGFLALFVFALPFPLVILAAACVGFFTTGDQSTVQSNEPVAPVARSKQFYTIALWAALWLLPLFALSLWFTPFFAAIGWFFAKLAVVSFGGAYAVLAYMSQTVVQDHAWITSGQMVDALGLAETTPGPLILVTQFVAMLAGHVNGGVSNALAAGLIALWATFVPCFLWIFAAAPHIERLTSVPRLNSALKAITATVVGVILNLSLWFTINVVFTEVHTLKTQIIDVHLPNALSLDLAALVLVVCAPVVLHFARGNMFILLGVMALAGIGLPFAGLVSATP